MCNPAGRVGNGPGRKRQQAWATIAAIMSNREVILRALERVRRRLRLGRALHDAATALGMLAVGLMLWRVLNMFAGSAPIVAAAVLAALLLWAGGLFLLARNRLAPRCTLGEAAASADARAGLKDELTTARWFLEHPIASPWIDAQVARAAESARGLDPVALLSLRVEWRELSGATAAALLVVVACLAPPQVVPPSDVAGAPQPLLQPQPQQVRFIRELIREEQDEAIARDLEQALAMLERKTASAEEKQRALSEAEQALEQQALEAAAMREGLHRLAATLRRTQRLEEVARALEGGNAQSAAKLMQQMAERHPPVGLQQHSVSPTQRDEEQELARLLAKLANDEDQAHGQSSGAAAKEAADRLTRIAQRLAAQDRWNQAAQALEQLRRAVARDLSPSLASSRQQTGQDRARVSDNAETGVAGANVHPTASNGLDSSPSGREGSKTGAVTADARTDAVLGAKVAALAVQLRQEAIDAEWLEAANTAPKNWFYAETKKQESSIDLESVRARSELTLGQSAALEGVAVRHRQIVKAYFMALHRGARP